MQAHERTIQCSLMDAGCNNAAEEFLRACLRALPTPDAALCIGVPAPSTFSDMDFADRLCAQHGWSDEDGDCDPIADGLSIYCHSQP